MPQPNNKNRVRIISGRWRGRWIHFPTQTDLRPTGDRIRETLFNWLAPYLAGSYCLDLFAGSGALGFEALSRGAAQVTFIDQSRTICQQLRHTAHQLDTQQATILQDSMPHVLTNLSQPADIIFLDPPFHSTLLQQCMDELVVHASCLKPNTLVYLEYNPKLTEIAFPCHWQRWRDQQAGQVCFQLWSVSSHPSDC